MLQEQAACAEAEAANLAKDRFLATLSHELRTPLTPVLATVTAMLGDPETPGSLLSVLEMIRRNVVLEVRLIDDLLDLSRSDADRFTSKREHIDAHQLIQNVIEICRHDLHAAELRLDVDLAGSPPSYRRRSDQQALWKLIKNAISSYELHRDLKVTQKTAWFMLHRIRTALRLPLGWEG